MLRLFLLMHMEPPVLRYFIAKRLTLWIELIPLWDYLRESKSPYDVCEHLAEGPRLLQFLAAGKPFGFSHTFIAVKGRGIHILFGRGNSSEAETANQYLLPRRTSSVLKRGILVED